MPSLGAYLLALGNLLCALTWWVCSLSAQLHVGQRWGSKVQGRVWVVVVVGGGMVLLRVKALCGNFENTLLSCPHPTVES